jgi:hypothetical protein
MSSDTEDLTPPSGSLCPHYRRLDEELFEDLFSEVAKVRSDRPDLFRFTHRPITVFERYADENKEVSEEEILAEFNKERQRNLVTIIDGNVGTGKSELCAYLSLELQEAGREVLHIDKNADLLTIMAEEIPQFYERVSGGDTLEKTAQLKTLQRHVRDHQRLVARRITAGAILTITELESSNVDLTEDQEDAVSEFVERKITNLGQRGELATKIEFVRVNDDVDEVASYDFLDVFEGVDNETAAENWNEAIWQSIQRDYGTPTMDKLLAEVAERLNERPVLVFEDFAVSALDAERIQKYLEEDSPQHTWDFIIAGTQESIQPLDTSTTRDRKWIRFYRTNKRGSNQVLFLDNDTAVDFARPFLGYVKSLDNSVQYVDEERKQQLAPPDDESLCARCDFCDDRFRDLFPFNQTFIQRIYRGLDEEEQRPRKFIQTISEILSAYYHEDIDVPAMWSRIDEVLANPIVLDNEAIYDDEPLRRLAQWYGTRREIQDQRVVTVDQRFVRAFGLDEAAILDDYDITSEHIDGSDVFIIPLNEGSVSVGGGMDDGGGDQRDPVQERYDETRRHIDTWKSDTQNRKASNVDVYIKRGLTDAIDRLTNGFEIHPNGELELLVGGEGKPFAFTDEDPDGPDQIRIDPDDFTYSQLLTLLRFGITRDMNPREADYEGLFDELGSQLAGYAQQWQARVQETYLTPEYFDGKCHQDRTFEEFVVGAYGVLAILSDPSKEATGKRLATLYTSDTAIEIDDNLDIILNDFADRETYQRIVNIFDVAEEIDALFGDLFAVSSNVVDVPRVDDVLDRTHPFEIGRDLTKSSLNNLPGKVRFDTDTDLSDVGLKMYHTVRMMDDLPADEDASGAPSVVNDLLRGIDMQNVREITKRLDTYDSVGSDVKERLSQLSGISDDQIDGLLTSCLTYHDLAGSRVPGNQQQAHLLGLAILGHDITELLISLDLEADGGENDSENFTEMCDIYASK